MKELFSEENKYLPKLSDSLVNQYENSIKKDSATVYSAAFYQTDIERKLVLILKNPSKRAFLNQIVVRVYPKNIAKYKNSKNYNEQGYLDYSTTTKPVLHHFSGNNYSLRTIHLPFIEIEKMFVIQHGIWKNTFTNPFTELNINKELATIDDNKTINFFDPILANLFDRYNIKHIIPKNDKSLNLNNYLKTNNLNILEVTDSKRFWQLYEEGDARFKNYANIYGNSKDSIVEFLNTVVKEKQGLSEIVNIDKLTAYYSIINLFSDNKSKKIGLIFNKDIQLFEPFYLNSNNLGSLNTYIKNQYIKDLKFLANYPKKLDEISRLDIDDLIENTDGLSQIIKHNNLINPEKIFNPSILKINQLILRKSINPSTALKAEFISLKDNTLTLSVKNLCDFPIEISSLYFQEKKFITDVVEETVIVKYQKDTLSFNLPRSFENLFVQKKSKTTGFVFEKNIYDLSIAYNVTGINDVKYAEIIPYQPTENYNKSDDLFRTEANIGNVNYLTLNESDKTININSGFTLKTPLILPKDYIIKAKPGITINIEKGGKIISYSPFEFVGTKEQPIKIVSNDKEGQGLLVLAEGRKSTLKHVQFDWLTNPIHGMWSTTSAVTFYESPVSFDYVRISNNTCEDAINVVRGDFKMTNTLFLNTQSDAFDGDFVTGTINSCVFKNLGNDAIDVSGSNLKISNVKVINAGDKALSAGEDSQMSIDKVDVSNCEIALAGKDLSIVTAKNLNITNTKLGFTAFQKKPEFGPSNITVTDIKMDGVETKYLIENTSSLMVDGEKIETKQADVKSKMYGVEFGVSSDETRNRKQSQ